MVLWLNFLADEQACFTAFNKNEPWLLYFMSYRFIKIFEALDVNIKSHQ